MKNSLGLGLPSSGSQIGSRSTSVVWSEGYPTGAPPDFAWIRSSDSRQDTAPKTSESASA